MLRGLFLVSLRIAAPQRDVLRAPLGVRGLLRGYGIRFFFGYTPDSAG